MGFRGLGFRVLGFRVYIASILLLGCKMSRNSRNLLPIGTCRWSKATIQMLQIKLQVEVCLLAIQSPHTCEDATVIISKSNTNANNILVVIAIVPVTQITLVESE